MKSKHIGWIASAASLLAPLWAHAGESPSGASLVPSVARIELRQDVQLRQAQVSLGEVANITSHDLPTLQRLMALPLGLVPRSGEPIVLEEAALLQWIRTRLAIDPQQIAWTGAPASHLKLAVETLSGEQIASSARSQLLASLDKRLWRGEVTLLEAPRDVTVPSGVVEFRLRPIADGQLPLAGSALSTASTRLTSPAKRQTVWVDLWVDRKFARTVPVTFELSMFAPAYVAATNLPQGQVIDSTHTAQAGQGPLAVREVEWTGRRSAPWRAPNASVGTPGDATPLQPEDPSFPMTGSFKLRRSLAAGEPITQADVEAVPLVARGDYATLHAIQGPIDLESRVEVLQDGAVGQSVRVKLPNASSAIVARVTGQRTVEIRQ